jgi:acetyl esterase/lipase
MPGKLILPALLLGVLAMPGYAQLSPSADFAVHLANQYQIASNVTYRTINNQEIKLDVYYRRGVTTPQPTLVFMHGGFWVAGNKDTMLPALLPWMEMGWNIVNVEYRLGPATLAPAALDDCLCALKWVAAQPQVQMYHFDASRLVVSGESAGGHLSLSLGIIPDSAGLGADCPGPTPKVAAVVNFFGISDVADVIDGPNRQAAAARWFGDMPNKMEVAKRVSPLTYVRAGLPPILTIHGDSDTTVPYAEAVKLHQELAKLNVPNQLLTIPGGRHGNFTADERTKIYLTIREFLTKYGILK